MKDTKYRLKKDTPFYKKGTEFCENWNHKGELLNDDCIVVADLNELDNPDEWFEEVKEEPKRVRKQIKRIEFRIPDGKNWSGNDYVVIEWRYIKDYYYMDSEWGVAMCYKKGLTSRYDVENVDACDDAGSKSRAAADKRLINLANQLVRDGYIEIKDNPNIVWEDEKCD